MEGRTSEPRERSKPEKQWRSRLKPSSPFTVPPDLTSSLTLPVLERERRGISAKDKALSTVAWAYEGARGRVVSR